ncbi:MAG: DUF2846 domain-containing protein [Zoogloeaceae bacterium]|nr:DUF2846 domain-containing protein [Zoogloeaceae bacterium]
MSVVLAAVALLAACATPPPPPAPPAPPATLPGYEGARPPETGQARLYVFRPRSEDQALQHEQPMLRLDDVDVTVMPEASYAELQLPPGRHVLSLAPPDGGSDLWRTSMKLNFQPDSITFVAFWMAAGFERGSSGNTDTELLVLPVGDPEDTPAHVRIEPAAPPVAEPILRECCVRVFPAAVVVPPPAPVPPQPGAPMKRYLPVEN